MPLYEYHCPQCRRDFERLVSYNKANEVTCPYCGNAYAQRRLSKIASLKNSEGSSWSDSSCATSTGSVGG